MAQGVVMSQVGVVLRPAAVLPRYEAEKVVEALTELDVANGGLWIVNPGLWQRFDEPWNGAGGLVGSSNLVGTIGCAYGSPTRYDITLYRVTITSHGMDTGWTVESLCNDALSHAGLTLASCPRASLAAPPEHDPFRADGLEPSHLAS